MKKKPSTVCCCFLMYFSGVFSAVALGFVFITFGVHIYIFTNEDKWRQSFREYML